jgi:putative polyhydroxyalkanoate system protein
MSRIELSRAHALSLADARARVEHVAEKLAERFDVEWAWAGNVLRFSRSGVDGEIAVERDQVQVTAQLGFLLSALKGPIQQEVERYLEREFG